VPTLDAGSPARDNTGWKYRTSRTAGNIGSDPRHFIRAVIESAP
jgi:hypothetical protein